MKKLILILLIVSSGLTVFGQRSPVDDLFDRYDGKEGFTSVYISSRMFSLLSRLDSDDPDFNRLVNSIKGIKILAIDSASNTAGLNFIFDLKKKLKTAGYEELMTVREVDQQIEFMIREAPNGKIAELIMITGGKGTSVVSILGNMDLKTIADLSDNLDIDELQDLEKVRK